MVEMIVGEYVSPNGVSFVSKIVRSEANDEAGVLFIVSSVSPFTVIVHVIEGLLPPVSSTSIVMLYALMESTAPSVSESISSRSTL